MMQHLKTSLQNLQNSLKNLRRRALEGDFGGIFHDIIMIVKEQSEQLLQDFPLSRKYLDILDCLLNKHYCEDAKYPVNINLNEEFMHVVPTIDRHNEANYGYHLKFSLNALFSFLNKFIGEKIMEIYRQDALWTN